MIVNEAELLRLIPQRREDANKGSYGKLLIVAGSRGMSGAAFLAGLAAYRSGTGLVRLFTHEDNRVILQVLLPEAIIDTYTEADLGEAGADSPLARKLWRCLRWADRCIVGPGLGTSALSRALVEQTLAGICQLYADAQEPDGGFCLIADADALNLCAAEPALMALLDRAAARVPAVVTPHPLEMSRLSGRGMEEILADPGKCAEEFSAAHGLTVVLKGAHTWVASQPSWIYCNGRTSPALAKAGSGDVLTGCIAGMHALLCLENEKGRQRGQAASQRDAAFSGIWADAGEQDSAWRSPSGIAAGQDGGEAPTARVSKDPRLRCAQAAALGVLVHCLAGREAARAHGTHGVLARETADAIGLVLEHYHIRREDEEIREKSVRKNLGGGAA